MAADAVLPFRANASRASANVTTEAAKSNGYNYYIPKFERKGVSSDEVRQFAEALYEAGAKVQDDGDADDAPQSGRPTPDKVPF